MSERILIPLDGSELGEAAIAYVDALIARLAPEEKVEITLYHVITTVRHQIHFQGEAGMVSVPYTTDELAKMKEVATEYLNKASQGLHRSERITVTCMTSVNESAADGIIRAEEEVNANLVVMSTHGRGGISRFTLGSIADKVMRGGSVPVLMVRTKEAESANR